MKTRRLVLQVLLSVALLIMAVNLSCTLAAGGFHSVGLKEDGSVVAVGNNDYGQCNVGHWTGIVQVAAGYYHTVGLKDDRTVVAVGLNDNKQCDVGGWTDIIQVAAGGLHTVGLKSDGSVVAVGNNDRGQCNVAGWTNVTWVAAGAAHTVGLKSDGTVVAVGWNEDGQCNVGGWTTIAWVAAGGRHTVGVKADGTVVAVGWNEDRQCNVGGWTTIAWVAAGGLHTVGLRADGTVVAVGNNHYGQCNVRGWTDIKLVVAGFGHTVGLKSDGKVVAVGDNEDGQCDVEDWVLSLPPEVPTHTVTISSTPGGSVTAPGEGAFTYVAGTVVTLVATPATGYRFVMWSGDVATIADVNAATTTIAMEDDYEITARFTPADRSTTQEVSDGTLDARDEASTEVKVSGTATVTVVRYEENPGGLLPPAVSFGEPEWKSLDKYIDVCVPDITKTNEVEIRLYYTDDEVTAAGVSEESLRLFWWNGFEWLRCSASGVNTANTEGYSGYMWARITATTTPSLADLRGTPFGGYGHPSEAPQPCCCFIATAAFGADTARKLDIVREFRDKLLLPNVLGATLVSFYYTISPPTASFVSRHEVLRVAARLTFVDPIVEILTWSQPLWSAQALP